MRTSQQDRLRSALDALRALEPGKPLNGPRQRRAYAQRLFREKWFARTFFVPRMEPRWKGTTLDTLYEIAHYCLPRAAWSRSRKSGEAWVRREVAWSFLALVQHKFGRDAAKALRVAYTEKGVKHRPRRVLSAAQKAVLQARAKNQFKKQVEKAVKAAVAVALAGPKRRRITFEDE